METLAQIVKNVALIVLLAAFIELLLPEREMARYVQLIMSLFVLVTILHPLASVVLRKSTPAIEGFIPPLTAAGGEEVKSVLQRGNEIRRQGVDKVTGEMKEKSEQQLEALIGLISGIDKAEVSMEFQGGEAAEVERILVTVYPSRNEGGQEVMAFGSAQTEPGEIELKVKEFVSSFYGFPAERVDVKVN